MYRDMVCNRARNRFSRENSNYGAENMRRAVKTGGPVRY